MAKMNIVNLKNEKTGEVDLPDSVFGQKVNSPLVLQIIKAQLAGLRQGTASTKTKGLVRGGGKKPFKQKGTGNARQGSSRSPLMPGGGSAFGPLPRKYNQFTPKEMIRGALRSVLSDKLAANRLIIIDKFNLSSNKTKELNGILNKSLNASHALLVDAENKNLKLACSNLPRVNYVRPDQINTYDMVKHEWLLLSKETVDHLVKYLG